MNKSHLIIITAMTILVLVSISSTLEQVLAVETQMTFYNTSGDSAMIELSDSKATCILQPHQSCPLQTMPQYYTVSVCVTYCSTDNLFLYTEYNVYGSYNVYLNQSSATNFTVTNKCPDKEKQNPKTQTLVLTTPDSRKNNTRVTLLPSCGIQCHAGVSESINIGPRNEIRGNTTGALLHLEAAQEVLNVTSDDGNLAQQMLRNIH